MILLNGATGNVGLPLVWLLSEAGILFRAFVRHPGRAQAALGAKLGSGVEIVRGDLAEPATLGQSLLYRLYT